jgi:hypothetical protein
VVDEEGNEIDLTIPEPSSEAVEENEEADADA